MSESAKKRRGKSKEERIVRSSNWEDQPEATDDYTDNNEVAGFDELSRVMEPELPPDSAPQQEELPYTVGTWRGFPQWKCKLCPWDTLKGEAAMLEHLASAHAPPPEPKSPILVADKSGRQIN